MFMAKPHPENEFRRGSGPHQAQQLPSFSHFLSGVQHPGNPSLHSRQPSLSQQEASSTFRKDPFTLHNNFRQPSINSNRTSPQALQHIRPQEGGRGTILAQDTYSPPHTEQQNVNPFPGSHPFRPHHDIQCSTEPSPIMPVQGETGPNKIVVNEVHIDGKGLCYVYDDGTVCPKAVNGDAVNPKWGTTKAGKPRKRLGQACNTCREKKIRCDPQVPKCTQCQKFGRECKFESGGRGSQKGSSSSARASPTTPELRKEFDRDRHGSSVSAETPSDQLYSRENSRSSIQVGELLSPSSTAISDGAPPNKKRKMSMSPKQELVPEASPWRPSTPDRSSRLTEIPQQSLHFSVGVNPLDVDRNLTLRYLQHYMDNVNSNLYHILPPSAFLMWAKKRHIASSGDFLVLYAVMSFGTTYSDIDDSLRAGHGKMFSRIALDILRHERIHDFHRAVGQLILSFQAFAEDDSELSQQLVVDTLRLCCGTGMNTEDGLSRLVSQNMTYFGFDAETIKECVRRVFWLAYIGNTFHNLCADKFDQDFVCDLRLPCDDASYDDGLVPELPIFHCNASEKPELLLNPGHGMIAFLAEIAFILENIIRFQRTTTNNYGQAYESFYHKMKARLMMWEKKIKKNLSGLHRTEATACHDEQPRPTSSEERLSAGLSGLHLLHHFVAMVLHRDVAWQHLAPDKLERCVKETHSLAVRTLELVHRLDDDGGTTMPFARLPRTFPIASVAVLTAADVITAAGTISQLFEHQHEGRGQNFKEMISCAISTLEDLSRYWPSAKGQSKLIQERLKPILSLSQSHTKNAFFFRSPLQSPSGLERDIIYGPSRLDYFKARGLGDRVSKESDMMELGVQSPR